MKSRTTAKFRKAFAELPVSTQEQARAAYRQFMRDPWHPSLRFKPVHSRLPIYSARVGKGFTALWVSVMKTGLWVLDWFACEI